MKKIFIIISILFMASCSTQNIRAHGNIINKADLSCVETGETSKNDIIMIFGPPTTKSTFDKEIWYYIGETLQYKFFMKPNILNRKVVEFHFDDSGIVESIKEYSLEDGKEIRPSEEETKSLATEKTFLQQLIGNIGKFNSN